MCAATMPRHELELLFDVAQRRLASLKRGHLAHRRLENAMLSLDDALNADERRREA